MPQRSQQVSLTHTETTVKVQASLRSVLLLATKESAKEAAAGAAAVNLVAKILELLHRLSLRGLVRVGDIGVERNLSKTL